MSISHDTRKRLENIVRGTLLEGPEDNCTVTRNHLCASFRTSTTVKKDFEGQSRIKAEQAEFLNQLSPQWWINDLRPTLCLHVKKLLASNGFQNTKRNDYFNKELGIILEDMHDENIIVNSKTLFFIDTVFYTVSE